MRPDLCCGSFLSCRFVVVSLFIFIKKLKDRHWKEHLFVAAMPVFIDIVGFIASVIALAGGLRNLITEIFGEKSKCFRFATYLTEVERVLKLYMSQAWQEIDEIRRIVEMVRDELARARDLVSPLRDKKGFWKIINADRYAKDLEESQAAIGRYLGLMRTAALAYVAPARTAQDGQEHNGNGNEALDYAFALSVYENDLKSLHDKEQREANREESSQVSPDEEFDGELASALQASLEEALLQASLEEALEDEEIERAIKASLA